MALPFFKDIRSLLQLWRMVAYSTFLPLHTHKLESVFTELLRQQKCSQDSKPHTPAQHLRDLLYIHHPKHEDELVEDKVPELVSHVLVLDVLELTEDQGVDEPD